AEAMDSGYRTTLDLDSTEVPVYGEQAQCTYNITSSPRIITRWCCSMARVTARPRSSATAPRARKGSHLSGGAAFAKPEVYEALRGLPRDQPDAGAGPQKANAGLRAVAPGDDFYDRTRANAGRISWRNTGPGPFFP